MTLQFFPDDCATELIVRTGDWRIEADLQVLVNFTFTDDSFTGSVNAVNG